jgi:hypothetical protein
MLGEVLELVANFSTSPSSSETQSVCIFYCVFKFGRLYHFCWGFIRRYLSKKNWFHLNRSSDVKVIAFFVRALVVLDARIGVSVAAAGLPGT